MEHICEYFYEEKKIVFSIEWNISARFFEKLSGSTSLAAILDILCERVFLPSHSQQPSTHRNLFHHLRNSPLSPTWFLRAACNSVFFSFATRVFDRSVRNDLDA